jgi:hypothetical protein
MTVVDRAFAVLFAVACGCSCHGKGQPAEHVAEAAKAEAEKPAAEPTKAEPPQLQAKDPAQPTNRFEEDRRGFVKAKLGDKPVEFTVLPRKHNRVALGTKPPLVVVDGYASADGGEHLRVHIQGVDLSRAKGRPLLPTKEKSWLVAITYQDAQGKTFVGRVGDADGVKVDIRDVDPAQQRVAGSFSGKLREPAGAGVIEVVEGAFETAIAG